MGKSYAGPGEKSLRLTSEKARFRVEYSPNGLGIGRWCLKTALDAIDRRILKHLQDNARLTNVELAEKVGISSSPCWRRVRALEEGHVIARYVTLIDPVAAGLPISVFINVSLEKQIEPALQRFEKAVRGRPEILECYLMTATPTISCASWCPTSAPTSASCSST